MGLGARGLALCSRNVDMELFNSSSVWQLWTGTFKHIANIFNECVNVNEILLKNYVY